LGIDYKQSGVDIQQGDSLVDWLKSTSPSEWPHQSRLVEGIGGFSALFRADFQSMQEPCLVSCTDGVGTKVKLASYFSEYAGVGQDLVAMCVNDMICVGAQPLFFLDYYATGKLEQDSAREFLGGVRQACLDSDMALIGGETAEMPDVYQKGDFDCAGFSVGVVDRPKALGAHRVEPGHSLLGISSSGFHSNGFSLLRKVYASELDRHKDELLRPTALYPKFVNTLLQKTEGVAAIANITGGGMDNIPRVLPKHLVAQLAPWELPESFLDVKSRGDMKWMDLLTTLNCGIGLVLVCEPGVVNLIRSEAKQFDFEAIPLGTVLEPKEALPETGRRWSLNEDELSDMNGGF